MVGGGCFGGWQDRAGPRYQRLAAALLDAVSRRVLGAGVRVPPERTLARAVGVSRGTVVACFDELVGCRWQSGDWPWPGRRIPRTSLPV